MRGFVDGELVVEAEDEEYAVGAIAVIVSEGSLSIDKLVMGKAL